MNLPLGPRVDFDGTCQRAIGPTWQDLCPKVGCWHIIWDRATENSMACEQHAMEATIQLGAVQMHERTLDCGMPGAFWVEAERRCIRDGQPVLIITEEVQFAND